MLIRCFFHFSILFSESFPLAERILRSAAAGNGISSSPAAAESFSGNLQNSDLRHLLRQQFFEIRGLNGRNSLTGSGRYFRRVPGPTDRRSDNALIAVKVHPFIKKLIEKYRGKEYLFTFRKRYSSAADFNRALNIGLKEIGRELNIDNLQFYSARHSMATVAVNELGISKYVVNDMLNHVEPSMKVTDLYIKKDFTTINEANFKLIDYVVNMMT